MCGCVGGGRVEQRQELAARTVVVPCAAGREKRAVALSRAAGRTGDMSGRQRELPAQAADGQSRGGAHRVAGGPRLGAPARTRR